MRDRLLALGINAWVGLALLIFAIVYWLQADALPRSVLGGSVGSAGLPKVLGVALALMACLLVAQSLLMPEAKRNETQSALPSRMEFLRALGVWAIGIGFVMILPWAGYPLSVAALLFVVGIYYGRRPSLGLVAFAIGGAIVFYLLFVQLLNVPMPLGIWMDLLNN